MKGSCSTVMFLAHSPIVSQQVPASASQSPSTYLSSQDSLSGVSDVSSHTPSECESWAFSESIEIDHSVTDDEGVNPETDSDHAESFSSGDLTEMDAAEALGRKAWIERLDRESSAQYTAITTPPSSFKSQAPHLSSGHKPAASCVDSKLQLASSTLPSAPPDLFWQGVTLNVYGLDQSTFLGRVFKCVRHSTVEFQGDHWSFGGTGRNHWDPLSQGWILQESINMGLVINHPRPPGSTELAHWIRDCYQTDSYRYLQLNCNSYCSELLYFLVRKESPAYINAPARLAARLLGLAFFWPLPAICHQRPVTTDPNLQQPLAAPLGSASLSSELPPINVSTHPPPPLMLSPDISSFTSQKGLDGANFITESVPVLSALSPVLLTASLPLETAACLSSNTLSSLDLVSTVPVCPPPETATPEQKLAPQPRQENLCPPPQPPPAPAAPKPTSSWRHRRDWIKPFWPKKLSQSVPSTV